MDFVLDARLVTTLALVFGLNLLTATILAVKIEHGRTGKVHVHRVQEKHPGAHGDIITMPAPSIVDGIYLKYGQAVGIILTPGMATATTVVIIVPMLVVT
jgi:hypothetical protein